MNYFVFLVVVIGITLTAYKMYNIISFKIKTFNINMSSQNEKFNEQEVTNRDNRKLMQCTELSQIPENWPFLDLCMVTYNSLKWLPVFLKSLENQDYPLKKLNLYFTDNGSTDGTVNFIQQYIIKKRNIYNDVNISLQSNVGFGMGTDAAISRGSSAFCLITNIDLEFFSDSITKAVRYALSDTNHIVASWELRQTPFEHPKHYDPVTLETAWSSHACILLRRDAYQKVGGYDKNIFMYAEDVELSYRFRSFGYHLKYIPSAKVIHHTYEYSGEIKPLQLIGSISGNFYLRLKYGTIADKFKGFLLLYRFLLHPPIENIRIKILRSSLKYLFKSIKTQKIGSNNTYYPFRGFDYLLSRFGQGFKILPYSTDRNPLITVIIRTYKGRDFLLQQAIQSVINQTYSNIELIVTEDGGNSTEYLVGKFQKRASINIRYIANEKVGRCKVANRAMKHANGEYIVFLDDDDLFYADHLEILLNEILSNDTAIAAYSVGEAVKTDINYDKKRYKEFSHFTYDYLKQDWSYPTLYNHNFMVISEVVN